MADREVCASYLLCKQTRITCCCSSNHLVQETSVASLVTRHEGEDLGNHRVGLLQTTAQLLRVTMTTIILKRHERVRERERECGACMCVCTCAHARVCVCVCVCALCGVRTCQLE